MIKKENNSNSFLRKNWFLIVAVVYVFIPLDIIPDRIPLIGTLDDTMLLIIEIVRRYADYNKSKKG
jgi:uncharacterized membrane protein YkvA (DUF1232 family)